MPIRMIKDDSSSSNDNYPGGGGGNRGGGNGFLGIILMLFSRNPKLMIVAAILFGGYYFFGGQCNSANPTSKISKVFNLGADLDPKVYDQAEVYEPLADNRSNPMPESVSLEKYCPQRLNQGQQGSCVGWGSTYAARTILQARASEQDPNTVAFSPAYVYNQIHLEDCQGSYILKAMEVMQENGALPFEKFKYTDQDCNRKPNSMERKEASAFKIKGADRLSKNGDDYKTDLLAIKQHLVQGAPVVVGMMVGGTFMQEMLGQKIWIPSKEDYDMRGFGGHCMCVVGYDDYMEGGAFRIMNSWGEEWGEKGLAWIRYKDFDWFCKEAYGLYPMGGGDQNASGDLDIQIGLISNDDGSTIELQSVDENKCITTSPIKKGSKFKMEVKNNIACYTYVFGEETDGKAYVLFPYTKKHSPYCGITGTRLFPKDYSMQADAVGSKDRIAIVVSREPLDYVQLNEAMNASKATDFEAKLKSALGNKLSNQINTSGTGKISAKGPLAEGNCFEIIVEIAKN
ncbi:hypothetical protein BH11BAC2_BH11BAC2_15640 [soil metagenome]